MATALKFKIDGEDYESVPVKLERKKLYGYTDVVPTDGSGKVCQAAKLDPDGSLIVPPGGIKSGIISFSGKWVDRAGKEPPDMSGR